MTSLFQYAMANPQLSPMDALRSLVTHHMGGARYAQGPMNPALQQGQGQRTPNMNGPTQFASPSVAQLGLPGAQGSPHIGNSAHPSPAQNHLAGPAGLVAQQNQTGVGANGNPGANASTSPNVSNKRRRASTVKTEGDEGGGSAEVNGTGAAGTTKVKASPRVSAKRQKGTA